MMAPCQPTMSGAELHLTLMRHAKSSWHDDTLQDHDRPLNARGRADAPRMAHRLASLAPPVSHLCCSSAMRTQETAALMHDCLSPDCINAIDEALYLAGDGTLWQTAVEALAHQCVQADGAPHVLVLAHFPGIQTLSARLCATVPEHFPTAAYCHLILDRSGFEELLNEATGGNPPVPEALGAVIRPGCIFDYPKRLDD